MAADQEVLREYLVSLGFRTDAAANLKFGTRLTDLDKKATALGKALAGVAVTAATMAGEFAFRMERLYYSSKLAGAAAGNLQALDFGGKQAGLKDFTGMVLSLARNIRSQPGLTGLINSLGVKVEGRDMGDVALDLAEALNKMPPFLAQRFGSMFGWDADDLFLMRDGIKTMREAAEQRKQLAADLGIDTEKAAAAGKQLAQEWRGVAMQAGLFRDALTIEIVPKMHELAGVTNQVLQDWVRIIRMDRQKFLDDLQIGTGMKGAGGGVVLSPEARARLGEDVTATSRKTWEDTWFHRAIRAMGIPAAKKGPTPGSQDKMDDASVEAATAPDRLALERERKLGANPALLREYQNAITKGDYSAARAVLQKLDGMSTAPAPAPASGSKSSYLQGLENKYALPSGSLDFIWNRESGRGKNMLSPVGARGHFGFMPPTAEAYGVRGKENDFAASSEASAQMMRDLMKRYGDMRFALAAYNWGSGNLDNLLAKTMEKHPNWSQDDVDKYVLGHMPRETRDYVNAAQQAGVTQSVTVNSTINVNGTDSPREVAREVANTQQRVYSDVVRNNRQRLQ